MPSISRLDYFRNKRLLWGKAQSSQAVSGPPSAVSGQSITINQPQTESAVKLAAGCGGEGVAMWKKPPDRSQSHPEVRPRLRP